MGAAEGPEVIGSYQSPALLSEEENDVSHGKVIRHLHLEPAREESRLKGESRNDVDVVEGEFEDMPDLALVDALDHGHCKDDLDTCFPAAFNG